MRLILILSLFILSACAGGQLSKSVEFSDSSDKALIVLSVESDGSGLSSPRLIWAGYDPNTMVMNEERFSVVKRTDTSSEEVLLTMLTGNRDRGGKHYYVFDVKPGGYFLEYISSSYSGGYVRKKLTTVYKTNSPSFVAEAGKVYFVGDFLYTESGYQNTLKPLAGDHPAAVKFIQTEYPKVSSEIIHQRAILISLDCKGQRKNIFGSDTDFCAPGETWIKMPNQ